MTGTSPSPTPSLSPKQPFTTTITSESSSPFQHFTPEPSLPSPRSKLIQHAHLILITLSAIFGLAIMATSAHTLHVYKITTLATSFHLPIWPRSFDLKPTIAGVVCGVIILVMNCVALVGMFVPALSRQPHSLSTLLPLTLALIAAIISTALPFNALTFSTSWSLQSWSCQWSNIHTTTAPHWGSLCMETRAAGIMSACVVGIDGLCLVLIVGGLFVKGRRGEEHVKMGWERNKS